MSDLDDKLIIEAMSRRGFLGTLGKAAAAAGLSPKLPIPNLKDDDDDDDDYEGDDWTDNVEGHDIEDWINDNVLDYTIDQAIGDSKISNSLADKIQKMVSNIVGSGEDISNDLMDIFTKRLNDEMSRGKRFYETIEDPEFVELMTVDMSNKMISQLNLNQVIANAAARELRGDKPEDILKDVDAEFEAKLNAEWDKRNNPIEYSKFDTAGGKKDYNYTADSYIMSNKDSKMLSEAYLNEIAFTKNVNYNDEDRVKDTLHDIADRKDKKKWKFDPLDPESEDGYHEESEESLSRTVHNNITKSLFPIGNETPKQAFIRTIKRFKPERVAAYFNLPVDEFRAKYYNVKRGRPSGYKGVIQKSGSKITPADLEIIIGLNLPQDKDIKITQPNHALYGKVIRSIPHGYKDFSRGLNVREIKKYMEKFPHKFTDPSVSEREINMTLQKAGINPGKGYGNF